MDSVSEKSFHIESDEDGEYDEENEWNEYVDNGNGSDSSDDKQPSKIGSYNTAWPASYRMSIDMLTSVASPPVGFFGSTSLGSTVENLPLSSSLIRRHPHDTLPSSLSKPLIAADEQLQERQRHSSYYSPRYTKKFEKSSIISHGSLVSRQSSFGQSVFNGMNVLCGVGILSTPYAAKEGGWLGLSILFMFGVFSFYTGILLSHCLNSGPGMETYPDIGQAAFGTKGRVIISIILYVELYFSCIEYIILESDNLSSLFPNVHISLSALELNRHHLFAIITTLAILPTVWLRDMSILSYLSVGGVIATVTVVSCLFWVGAVDGVGFENKGTTVNLTTLPVAIGLYGFCYSGHAVFPNIYTSMAKPSRYPYVLLTCFILCGSLYAGVAVMGYMMFGESTSSQFTLNLSQNLVASKIAVWTTVVNPFTKYALTIFPVAMCLEELIPENHPNTKIYSILIRTGIVISTLIVGLTIPFFGLVMSFIGSLLTMLVTLILPCACFLSIRRGRVTCFQGGVCVVIMTVGVVSSGFGTYSAVSKIIEYLTT